MFKFWHQLWMTYDNGCSNFDTNSEWLMIMDVQILTPTLNDFKKNVQILAPNLNDLWKWMFKFWHQIWMTYDNGCSNFDTKSEWLMIIYVKFWHQIWMTYDNGCSNFDTKSEWLMIMDVQFLTPNRNDFNYES